MPISTTQELEVDLLWDKPPLKVMQTAYESDEAFNFTFSLPARHSYHYSILFAELSVDVTSAGERAFVLQVLTDTDNFGMWNIDPFLSPGGIHGYYYPFDMGNESILYFTFTKANGSIYGPIVCGLEILQISDHDMPLGTDDNEVATLKNVTSQFLRSLITWSGDPCLPYAYDWLTCTTDSRPFISTISLSNQTLVGDIPTSFNMFKALTQLSLANNQLSGSIPDLSSLQQLEALDLHGNSLSGPIPDYLGELPRLTTLNLANNNFSGEIPSSLLALGSKINFSVAGNPLLSNNGNTLSTPGLSKSKKVIMIISITVVIAAAGVLAYCIINKKMKKKTGVVTNETSNTPETMHPQQCPSNNVVRYDRIVTNQSRRFSFDAIKTMTRNFERLLGKGGFGSVYYGFLEDEEIYVAVKIEGEGLHRGEQQFFNEVQLLSRVHHKNLVRLVGYCIEGPLALVYEFMLNGSLAEALRGKGAKLAAWNDRLRIAVDASEGLEYLHQGCNPPIIHRDVKSGNILLGNQYEVKISDFGISKSRPNIDLTMMGDSQTLTAIQGSLGYLDPVYMETNVLDRSIDVYAFGIVLFELVTGKSPVIQPRTNSGNPQHIVNWVIPHVENGDISGLVDPTLDQNFNGSSMWKVIDLALLCVDPDKRKRPTMSDVKADLRSALSMDVHPHDIYDPNTFDPWTGGSAYPMDVRVR